MVFKKNIIAFVTVCVMAIHGIALCSCDDLGAYSDTDEYYSSFGDIVLINSSLRNVKEYSVKDYFYNKESREDFLAGNDGAYSGVEHSDYVYVAIPFECSIEVDTVALYIRSHADVTVYINAYVTDRIPSNWRGTEDLPTVIADASDEGSQNEGENEEETYDDPDPETRVGEVSVRLTKDKWNSFVLDFFKVNGINQKSMQINEGQYLLLQIRNNSGVRIFDDEKQSYIDIQTGLELQKAEITMTNLLIRALDVKSENEAQGGE